MAHWISSKLKAAENLLQQIDQQAAESLRKGENLPSDDSSVVENSFKSLESKPLIKDQLKKKSPENVVNQSIVSSNKHNINVIQRSNNEFNGGKDAGEPLNSNLKSDLSNGLPDNDWTELLSVPDRRVTSWGGSASPTPRRASGIQALKKDSKKPGLNLSLVDKRSEKTRDNGVSKSSRKSDVGSEISSSGDSDEKVSSVRDAAPRSSSVKSPGSGGELDPKDYGSAPVTDNSNVKNIGKVEGPADVVDGEKLHHLDSELSANMTPISHERELDMNVGLDGGSRFEGGMGQNGRSALSSGISGSVKKGSLPSDGDFNSETDSTSSSDSESEREREERQKRRQQVLAEKAAAKALQAIKERENLFARLEGEKQSLEKIIEERAKQQVQEASELQSTMMETMEAVELEKQKHNNTRMEVLTRLAKLESTNADLARSLANAQKKLEVEVHRVTDLRQQLYEKEAVHEEIRRKISSSTHQNSDTLQFSKGVELELKMLEAEYSFITDKVERMQNQAKTLETSIETTRREVESPTDVETELKQRLSQLTDHLIQKQAQVETMSSEKATLLFRIEAISRMVDENKAMLDTVNLSGTSRNDLEWGAWQQSNSLGPSFKEKIRSGQRHFGSLVVQLDSLFCAGAVFLKRNRAARIWSLVYLICLHLWALYILTSHSQVYDEPRSGAVVSLENINNTGGV